MAEFEAFTQQCFDPLAFLSAKVAVQERGFDQKPGRGVMQCRIRMGACGYCFFRVVATK